MLGPTNKDDGVLAIGLEHDDGISGGGPGDVGQGGGGPLMNR